MEISLNDYLFIQPNHQKPAQTDHYYSLIAQSVANIIDGAPLPQFIGPELKKDLALAITGYFQDVVGDIGLWRSFITAHSTLYQRPLPFYSLGDDYVESELNAADIQFLIWYIIEASAQPKGVLSPYLPEFAALAQAVYDFLDKEYLKAPHPTNLALAFGVDTDDPSQAHSIFALLQWLFWRSYLLRPTSIEPTREAYGEAQAIIKNTADKKQVSARLLDLNDRIMMQNTAGPLAFSAAEWAKMVIDGDMPSLVSKGTKPHKFYLQFTRATEGKDIAFFNDYQHLSQFLSEEMQWDDEPQRAFSSLPADTNFVIMASPQHGILIAPDVAQFICHPDNPLYNEQEAARSGHTLLTVAGRCPVDLVKYIFAHGLAPQWRLPYDTKASLDESILHQNHDFLLQFYQQRRYRHDF